MKTYIDNKEYKICVKSYKIENAKAILVASGGSGEYRTIDMLKSRSEAKWANENGYSYLAYDKFGCGESDGDWKTVTFDILRDSLVEICKKLNSESSSPIVLFGQSEGSIISAEAADILGDIIKGLVLRVPSHQNIEERMKYQYKVVHNDKDLWLDWKAGIEEIKMSVMRGESLTSFLHDYPKSYWYSRMSRKLTGDILQGLKIPVLVLNGKSDEYTPKFAYEYIHENIINHNNAYSRAKEYQDVGHSLTLPNQKWSESQAARDVVAWLDSIFCKD